MASLIPRAKIVELPPELGDDRDVTDYFVRFKKSREDFERLLVAARPAPQAEPQPKVLITSRLDATTRKRVERVKRAVPIEHVIERYVNLRRSGATLVGRCPFHKDHTPSFTVYPRTGVFHCFGCREHGDAITFLEEAEHLSFRQALDMLERLQTNDEARP